MNPEMVIGDNMRGIVCRLNRHDCVLLLLLLIVEYERPMVVDPQQPVCRFYASVHHGKSATSRCFANLVHNGSQGRHSIKEW